MSFDLTLITNEAGKHLRDRFAVLLGADMRFTKEMINDLPIPNIQPNDRDRLVSIVDRILLAKQRDAEADTSALEREIDELVYAFHGLTPEEIKLVEGASK